MRDPLVRPVLLLEPINIGAIERVTSGKCKVRRIECAAVIQIEHHGKHQAQQANHGEAQPQKIVADELFFHLDNPFLLSTAREDRFLAAPRRVRLRAAAFASPVARAAGVPAM